MSVLHGISRYEYLSRLKLSSRSIGSVVYCIQICPIIGHDILICSQNSLHYPLPLFPHLTQTFSSSSCIPLNKIATHTFPQIFLLTSHLPLHHTFPPPLTSRPLTLPLLPSLLTTPYITSPLLSPHISP